MKTILLAFFISVGAYSAFAQTNSDTSYIETEIVLTTKTGQIFGTLCTPKYFTTIPVALIIAGSGPTDRDGNNITMKNDAYKLLAHRLCCYNIATVRYDKRGVAKSKDAFKNESDIRFDDYVNDAKAWAALLKSDPRFSKVILIGHSEGSLIGMIAAKINADAFISIAGAGESADKILITQLKSQPQPVQDSASMIIDSLLKGKTLAHVPLNVLVLFRPSIQPYLISWFKYNPPDEIKKLTVPTLIIQGTDDLQVAVDDAKRLATAKSNAKLVLIKGMNHILKKVGNNKKENEESYNNPSLPIDENLVKSIETFIIED